MTGGIKGGDVDLKPFHVLVRDLVQEETYARGVLMVCAAGASAAQRLAPVEEGDYKKGLIGRVWKEADGFHAAIIGTDYKTVWIERGVQGAGRDNSINFPAHHCIVRGADSIGLHTNESNEGEDV